MKSGMPKILSLDNVLWAAKYHISVKSSSLNVLTGWIMSLNRSPNYANVVKKTGNVILVSVESAMDRVNLMAEILLLTSKTNVNME